MADNQLGGQIEGSFARSIDGIGGCGMGTTILFLLLILAVGLIVYLIWRNGETVNMVLKALVGDDHGKSDKNPG